MCLDEIEYSIESENKDVFQETLMESAAKKRAESRRDWNLWLSKPTSLSSWNGPFKVRSDFKHVYIDVFNSQVLYVSNTLE